MLPYKLARVGRETDLGQIHQDGSPIDDNGNSRDWELVLVLLLGGEWAAVAVGGRSAVCWRL